jgi:hypothetical protein
LEFIFGKCGYENSQANSQPCEDLTIICHNSPLNQLEHINIRKEDQVWMRKVKAQQMPKTMSNRETGEAISLSRVPCDRSLKKLIPLRRKPKNRINKASIAGSVESSIGPLGMLTPIKLAMTNGTMRIKAIVRRSRAS